MADIENVPIKPGGAPNSTPSGGKKKELSMEMRLLLAFLLMGLVLFLTPYIYKAPPPPKKPVTPPAAAQVKPEQKPPARPRRLLQPNLYRGRSKRVPSRNSSSIPRTTASGL